MHLIVLTEAAQADLPAASPPGHDHSGLLQRWTPLWGRLAPTWQLFDEPDALNTLAERALAGLVLSKPWPSELDGRIPLAAWRALRVDTPQAPSARLTPFHGLVGSDRITLVPPIELRLGEDESRALHASVQALFASEGVLLQWHSALEWTVQHASLRGLACASLARAMGDSVQRWQGRTPLAAARLMRRLQNEAQMVLHDHPVNLARAARGELTVNSLWLDHAGAADEAGTSLATDATARLGQVHVERWATCDHALQAWVAAAMAADAGPQSGANVRPGTGSDPGPNSRPTLVLCGRCTTQAFQIRPTPRGWRGVLTRIAGRPARPQALQAWLQQIDQFPSEGAST